MPGKHYMRRDKEIKEGKLMIQKRKLKKDEEKSAKAGGPIKEGKMMIQMRKLKRRDK